VIYGEVIYGEVIYGEVIYGEVIYGEVIYGIARRLANGKSMQRIQMPPIKISRCIGKPLVRASEWLN
jgi:hypothetical protein